MTKSTNLYQRRAHARFFSHWLLLPAYKSLSKTAKLLLIETLATFDRKVGNKFRITINGVCKDFSVGHKTAREAIFQLQDRGSVERIGVSTGPTGQIGGLYKFNSLDELGVPKYGIFEQYSFDRFRNASVNKEHTNL